MSSKKEIFPLGSPIFLFLPWKPFLQDDDVEYFLSKNALNHVYLHVSLLLLLKKRDRSGLLASKIDVRMSHRKGLLRDRNRR